MALRPFFAQDDFFGPSPWARDPFFNDPFFTDIVPMSVLNNEHDPLMVLRRSSPGYEIHEDDNKFQLSIDVPGVKAADMKVDLEKDGRVLHLSGGRKVEKEGSVTETRFDKRFLIAENVDTSKIAANLADGVLVVTAPKKVIEEEKTTTIAITEGPPADSGKIEIESKL
jgi:HSP20 family molecular chaperone IbpA